MGEQKPLEAVEVDSNGGNIVDCGKYDEEYTRSEENERVVEASMQYQNRGPGGQLGNKVELGAVGSDLSGQIDVDGAR